MSRPCPPPPQVRPCRRCRPGRGLRRPPAAGRGAGGRPVLVRGEVPAALRRRAAGGAAARPGHAAGGQPAAAGRPAAPRAPASLPRPVAVLPPDSLPRPPSSCVCGYSQEVRQECRHQSPWPIVMGACPSAGVSVTSVATFPQGVCRLGTGELAAAAHITLRRHHSPPREGSVRLDNAGAGHKCPSRFSRFSRFRQFLFFV